MTRVQIRHSSGPKFYPVMDTPAALAWLGQVAALELHVPQWRIETELSRKHGLLALVRPFRTMRIDLAPCHTVCPGRPRQYDRLVRLIRLTAGKKAGAADTDRFKVGGGQCDGRSEWRTDGSAVLRERFGESS